LQILDPFTELFEVGHTFSAHGSNAQIVVWVNERSVAQDKRRPQLICAPSLPRLITMAGIGARRSAFPVGKPHTAMRGAFALCDSPHGVNEGCPYTKTTLHEATRCRFSQNRATAMTNNEHAITLTDAELNEIVGGLNPQPLRDADHRDEHVQADRVLRWAAAAPI
jgi:hypothetical protein